MENTSLVIQCIPHQWRAVPKNSLLFETIQAVRLPPAPLGDNSTPYEVMFPDSQPKFFFAQFLAFIPNNTPFSHPKNPLS